MPIGFYPDLALKHINSSFVINERLCFSVVRFKSVELEDYYIEREWLIPDEIKLLSALALSVEDEKGKVYPYLHPAGFKVIDRGYDLSDEDTLKELQSALINKLKDKKHEFWLTVKAPPVLGGPAYHTNKSVNNLKRQREIFDSIDVNDHLLIRGLGVFLKGDLFSLL